MTATAFTPAQALFGGVLIGASAVSLMAGFGRIAGISGLAARLLPPYEEPRLTARALCFVMGLILARPLVERVVGQVPFSLESGGAILVCAGLLVGFGAVFGSGCTSGHGVCGLPRLSKRSFVAVGVFMTAAAATVFIVRHVLEAS